MIKSNLQKDDLWDIQRLFVHFNGNDGVVKITEEGELSLSYWNRQSEDQKKITLQKVKNIIKNWDIFNDLKISDSHIDLYFSSNLTIRASDIRLLYKTVMRMHLENIEKDTFASSAVGKNDFDRIVPKKELQEVVPESYSWFFTIFGRNQFTLKVANIFNRIFGNEINKKVRNDFLTSLNNQWGSERVKRILSRHSITLENNCEALRVQDIRKVYASLVQLKEKDIQEGFDFYKQYRKDPNDTTIPSRLRKKFDTHQSTLSKLFQDSDLDLTFDQLSGDHVTALIQSVSLDRKEIELCLLGNRIEGVIVGHRGFFDIYRFFHSDVYEDTEIAQVYQEIFENQNQSDQQFADLYFHELGTKLLVKKEGSQFEPKDLVGRLIPAPNGEWYKISNSTNKWGKFTLFLEPISEKKKGEGVIWQCSTAWSWSSSKNLSSMLQNINPLAPPGYLWGMDFSAEIEFIKSHKNVTITGHSLGGSFAQRTGAEWAKSLKKEEKRITTDIKVITFDSPGIKKDDDVELSKNELLDSLNIEIEHFFSYHDVVPFSGWMHLGAFSSNRVSVKSSFLYANGKENPEIKIHPHTSYWLRYYDKLKNIKARVLSVDELANFGKLHSPFWRGQRNNPGGFFDFRALVIDPVRRIGGVFAAPFMYPVVWIQETGMGYGINIKNKIANVIRFFFPFIVPTIKS